MKIDALPVEFFRNLTSEGARSGVVLADVAADGLLEVGDRLEDAPPEAPSGQRGEEALDELKLLFEEMTFEVSGREGVRAIRSSDIGN